MLKDIVEVRPLGGYRLYLRFEDGPFQLRCETHLTRRAVLKRSHTTWSLT